MNLSDFETISAHVDPLKDAIEALGLGLVCVIIAYPVASGAKLGVLADPDCPEEVIDTVTRRLNVKYLGKRGGKK